MALAAAVRLAPRRVAVLALLVAASLVGFTVMPGTQTLPAAEATTTGPCDAPVNPIVCENSLPGTAPSEWKLSGAGDPTIQGFGTQISVNKGETIHFKVKTDASAYRIDIYRMGYYQGNGARKLDTITPSAALPQAQPACYTDNTTHLVDCGNWAESASWAVPSTAVSGIYFAILHREDTGGEGQITWVVRDDSSHSDVLVQASDTTWQAYNCYGGYSLYELGDDCHQAKKVSYNRPFATPQNKFQDWVLSAEYPMIRFLEANGYDLSYTSGIDADKSGALLQNHRTFISSGHDEYWSGAQRDNVEAARDAGVNLAFFSGNEVYWKVRWEQSIDGSGQAYRTMVCYKESRDNAKIDPSSEWTGTWRDTRFSATSDGGKPENALTGTYWVVQSDYHDIQVPADDGKMRFWRNTGVDELGDGQVATLAPSTLAYEWDTDIDNGFRPAGLFQVAHSDVANATSVVKDAYGNVVSPGSASHAMTMYRAASGALVFGAGTIQWSWGLDQANPNNTAPDQRMQQATVNVLADMDAQPDTLISGLTAATKSTDHTGPTVTITSPTSGVAHANGATVTVSGTAADSGGGVVGGVEVSMDGGATWHPAKGRESWSYTGTVVGVGAVAIQVRASDDSGNIGAVAQVATTVSCPCTIFPTDAVPVNPATSDGSAITLGVKFTSTMDGSITGARFYKGAGNTGTHTATLWTADGTLLASGTFADETASGWQTVLFPQAVGVSKDLTYVIAYHAPSGHYAADAGVFTNAGTTGVPLKALPGGPTASNGVYRYGAAGQFPNQSVAAVSGQINSAWNYWVDAIFSDASAADVTPPSVTARTPASAATNVDPATTVTATISEDITSGSASFVLRDAANVVVPSTVAFNAQERKLTLTPNATLASGSTYTAVLSGAADAAGNVMNPVSWSFTTAGPRTCPCTIWDASATPAVQASPEQSAIELGVKFQATSDGWIYGLRFFKGAGNTGTHVGSLWDAAGNKLASVTFTGESATGWQQASIWPPIAVTSGTTYTASYYAPVGHYAYTTGAFATAGAGTAPIRALSNTDAGGNGVYKYGASGLPTNTAQAANYWVDVVFDTTAPSDSVPPVVAGVTPAPGATNVAAGTPITATFSEAVQPSTISMVVKDAANNTVAGTVSYDAPTQTAKFTPTASLVTSASYTATVSGAKDLFDNPLDGPQTWSFTMAPPSCPCTMFGSTTPAQIAGDSQAIEVGMKFRVDQPGYISGVRFYKSTGNTGTHLGSLWSATGTRLATAVFTGETASGWQTVTFASPVAVTPGTTYVVSYHSNTGYYAATANYFTNPPVSASPMVVMANGADGPNGVYAYGGTAFPTNTYLSANYWVDAVFVLSGSPDTTAPQITNRNPAPGATSDASAPITVTFNEPVNPSTIGLTLKDAANNTVAGNVSYNWETSTATLVPSGAVYSGQLHTVTVSAKDLAGNTMAANSWQFTPVVTCPCSIFPATATPAVAAASDTAAVEVGVKFRADQNGYITGLRFYKGAANTGTHIGHLWDASGNLLATATFSNESASGWQQVSLSTPIQVTAGTTYVASYNSSAGRYSYTSNYLDSTTTRAPVRALGNGVDGPNGVYKYGASSFPTGNGGKSNYWVDVVFTTSLS
ncbi:hypothetical protein CcI49_24070 [Frankia sp. CcI49]|uniref:DUF4082 domain-containing protein n=2 Tax=unclassified Frankia TaxID=2632575 RepID=UPI0006DA4F74|nr:DUF4082 domain-containing protein [Frankia sp. R43]KPM57829.1 hypothetical protein ACG83_07655 [Frankia sp. R43]ONH58002.1 hypothetical protein CcI49_24070 [Frankia sp. CcI49]